MPVPSAVISVPISAEPSILSKRARSTFRILPRSGRIAWKRAVAALLGRAAGAVALDDEELGQRRIALLAIGELAGQRVHVERALAAGQLAGLARRFARGGGLDDLGDDAPGLGRMLLEPLVQLLVDDALDHRPHLGGDQLVLGLRREFGIGHLAPRGCRSGPRARRRRSAPPSPSWRCRCRWRSG